MGQITPFLQSNLSCLKRTTGLALASLSSSAISPVLSLLIPFQPHWLPCSSLISVAEPFSKDVPWLAALLFRFWLKRPLFQEAFPDFIATVIPGVFSLIYILVYSLAFPSEQGLNCILLILMPCSWKAFSKYLVME